MKTQQFKTRRMAFTVPLFLIWSLFRLSAQETAQSASNYYGGFGYFTFSSEKISMNDLNHVLKESGYNTFEPSMPSWGGGGMFVLRNFLIGGQGAGYFTQTSTSDNSSAVLKGGYGQASLGYLFRTSKRSVLYPVVGIGGGGLDLVIGPASQSGDFSQQVKSPTGTMSASAGGWFLTAELTFNHFFLASELQGFFVGARAGYRYSPDHWQFSCNGKPFSNSPGVNLNGLYLTLLIGGGGIGH